MSYRSSQKCKKYKKNTKKTKSRITFQEIYFNKQCTCDDSDESYPQETAVIAAQSCKVRSQVRAAESRGHPSCWHHYMTSFLTAAAAERRKRNERNCQSLAFVLWRHTVKRLTMTLCGLQRRAN